MLISPGWKIHCSSGFPTRTADPELLFANKKKRGTQMARRLGWPAAAAGWRPLLSHPHPTQRVFLKFPNQSQR
jgi:hypothetical protein